MAKKKGNNKILGIIKFPAREKMAGEKHSSPKRKSVKRVNLAETSEAAIPEDIIEIKQQIREFFDSNPGKNYVAAGELIAGHKISHALYRINNDVVVAELKTLAETPSSTVLVAVDINMRDDDINIGSEYALKYSNIIGVDFWQEIEHLKDFYEDHPKLRNMMRVINVVKNGTEAQIAVMPKFLGQNALNMFNASQTKSETKKIINKNDTKKNTKKKTTQKKSVKIQPEAKDGTSVELPDAVEHAVHLKELFQETDGGDQEQMGTSMQLSGTKNQSAHIESLFPKTDSEQKKDTTEKLNSKSSSDANMVLAEGPKSPAELIQDKIKLLEIMENKDFEALKDILEQGVLSGEFKQQFISLLAGTNRYANSAQPLPAFSWKPNLVNPTKIEIVDISNLKLFLNNFGVLLDWSIQYCKPIARMYEEKGIIQRDLKLDNLNLDISQAHLFPLDTGEVLKLKFGDKVSIRNETAPHGTEGYLSPYNDAVYKYISTHVDGIMPARTTLAYYSVLKRLPENIKIEIMQAAGINTDDPSAMRIIEMTATLPPYALNAKSDANSIGVVLEQLSHLQTPIVKYDEKNGLPQSIAPVSKEQEPYVALFNTFLKITKRLLNPKTTDTYIVVDALKDLRGLREELLAIEGKFLEGRVYTPPARPVQPRILKNFRHVTDVAIQEKELLKEIENAFDIFASTPKITNKKISDVTVLKTGTLITIGSTIHKLKTNIYKFPNGSLVSSDIGNLDHGKFSVVRTWIDLNTGEQFAAKILNDYGTKSKLKRTLIAKKDDNLSAEISKLSAEITKLEKDAISEAENLNTFYSTYMNGKYKDKKTQVMKFESQSATQLVILMPLFPKKGIKKTKIPNIASLLEDSVTATNVSIPEEIELENAASEKNVKKRPNTEKRPLGIEHDEIFPPVNQDRFVPTTGFMSYYDIPPDTNSDKAETKARSDSLIVAPESAEALKTEEELEQEALEAAKAEQEKRGLDLMFGNKMEFGGDLVPLEVKQYERSYLVEGSASLETRLKKQVMGFIPNKFEKLLEVNEASINKKITEDIPNDFLPNLINVLDISKNQCLAVQHGHNENIVFTDINDDNLLTDENNEVYPIDFGGTEISENLYVTNKELELRGTLEFATPENRHALLYNIDNYPHAKQARKALAMLNVLKKRILANQEATIPTKFNDAFVKQLEETSAVPTYTYNEKSALFALGCTLEMNCIKNVPLLANDYTVGVGLPMRYQSKTNDPRIAIVNQFLKISKKLKDPKSIYTANDAAKDIEKLQVRIQKSNQVVAKLKFPNSTPMRLLEQVLLPRTTAKARAAYDPGREIWKNTAQSLAIELNDEKYDVVPQRDHSVKIQSLAENKTIAILKIVDEPNTADQFVEVKLISNDEEVIASNLRAILATAEPGAAISLDHYEDNPEAVLQLQAVATKLNISEGLNIILKLDAETEKAVKLFLRDNPDHHLAPKPRPSLNE